MDMLMAEEAKQISAGQSTSVTQVNRQNTGVEEAVEVSQEKKTNQKMTLTKKIFFLEQELQEARLAGQFLNQVNPIK